MFSIIYRLFWSRWRWCATRTLQIWRALLGLVSRRDPPYNPLYLNPLTHEQRKSQEDEFIKMLDQEAIRALASSYNDHLPCRILDSKTSHGSFNICFFVNFYTVDQTWVVRIPIKPAIHNVWEKLQSEVCTMQYELCTSSLTSLYLTWVCKGTFKRTQTFPFLESTRMVITDYCSTIQQSKLS